MYCTYWHFEPEIFPSLREHVVTPNIYWNVSTQLTDLKWLKDHMEYDLPNLLRDSEKFIFGWVKTASRLAIFGTIHALSESVHTLSPLLQQQIW